MTSANAMPSRISRRRLLAWGGFAAAAPAAAGAAAAPAVKRGDVAETGTATFTVGALFPDSGPLSLPGSEAFRGVLLALDTARRQAPHGGRSIRLIRADAVDAPGATRAAQKLIKNDHADLILGTCSSTLSFAASTAAELANIPYIELDAPADDITTRGFKTLARIGFTTTDLAKATVAALTDHVVPRLRRHRPQLKLGLLFDVGATDGAFAAAMVGACAAAKLPVAMTSGYAADTVDLVDHAERMMRAGIDVVVHAANPDGVIQFFEAMSSLGWRPRMVIGTGAGYGLTSTGFLLGQAIDDTLVIGVPAYQEEGPSAAVAQLYREHFAASPRSAASLTTYAGALPVFRALMAGQKLPLSLEAAKPAQATLANGWGLNFNAMGQNMASFASLQQWRGGRLVTLSSGREPAPGRAGARD